MSKDFGDRDDVIIMFDEDGNEKEFYIIGFVEHEEERFAIVTEDDLSLQTALLDGHEDESDDLENKMGQEILVFKELENNNGEIDYEVVEDDELLDAIVEKFEKQEFDDDMFENEDDDLDLEDDDEDSESDGDLD